MDGLLLTILISVAVVILVLVIFLIIYLSYNHQIIIHHLTNSDVRIQLDKAKKCYDADTGVTYYKFWALKEKKYGEAPGRAIRTDNKGKIWLEIYRLGKNQFAWKTEKNLKIINSKEELTGINTEDFQVIKNLEPITDDDRRVIIEHERRAEQLRQMKGDDWKKNLPQIIAYAFIAILIIGIFAFWGEIYAPVKEQQGVIIAQQKNQIEMMKIQTEATREIRILIAQMRGEQILPDKNEQDTGVTSGNSTVIIVRS